MKKHYVNCQIEEIGASRLAEMQEEANSYYVKLLENAMKKMLLTKKEQMEVINEIIKNIEINNNITKK